MADKKQQKEITSKTLYTIEKQTNDQRGTVIEIRVVDWIVEGKHYPQLEKREFFTTQDGDLKMGKAKGFTKKDLDKVQDKWGEIMSALGSKLPEDQRKPGAAAVEQPATPSAAPAGRQGDF